jgi:hypothetical protein
MLLTLPEIKAKVDQLAEKIGAPQNVLPTYGYSRGDGHPHIEISSQGYYYLSIERDAVGDRLITKNIDELLYKIFAFATFELALEYELAHRVKNQDSRRIMFQREVELLSMLSTQWAEQEAQEHEEILKRNPFDDYASARATLTRQLREQGISQEAASELADKQYLLPPDSQE